MLYGAQVWGMKPTGIPLAKALIKPMEKTQKKGLRTILGAYKRTPAAIMERETQILPIPRHIEKLATQ